MRLDFKTCPCQDQGVTLSIEPRKVAGLCGELVLGGMGKQRVRMTVVS